MNSFQADRRELLGRDPLFSSLPSQALSALVDACERLEVPGGTCILGRGEPLDALIGVQSGGLRLIQCTDDGLRRTVREFYRGDALGELALLGQWRSPFELYAIRDSTLLRISRERFLSLSEAHPSLLLALARLMSERAIGLMESMVGYPRQAPPARGGNIALLPLSLDGPVRELTDRLIEASRSGRRLCHVTAQRVDEALGAGASTDGERGRARVMEFLENLERGADVVLYECDPERPEWNARCRRQSDRLVVVAPADDERRVDVLSGLLSRRLGQAMAWGRPDGLSRPINLILVHPKSQSLPSGTRAWARLPDVRAVHHVRDGNRGDVARVVRRLIGRPTGLVLSGGGARGIAHVGVIAAIVEAGIPIDYVCGTSMGAIFGAGLAFGFDVPRLRTELDELFGRAFSLYDFTVPISSLLAGNKLDRVLKGQFGEADIEDLWLPFFCVSTDLSRAELVVHDRGPLWKAVRASCSIPGIFPPLPMDGRTLVDGGLVDNLPLDHLIDRCSGPIIAVDVFPYGDPSFEKPSGKLAAWLRELRTLVRGEPASPPLFDILIRSTLVGSKFRQTSAMSRAAEVVYLEPPVASFGALQWRSHRALFDAGYTYAKEALIPHRSLFPV